MKQIFGIAIFVFVFPFSVLAETSVEVLLDKVDRLYRSDSSHATMEMKIVTENWERTTVMEVWSRGMNDTLIKILSPRKDKGIKTLKLGNQMWNYFPKINKVLKVPPSMMMNSWMGSDFTNDDLVKENTLAEDYHAKLEEHPSDPNQLYFIVLRPKNETVTVWGKISISIRRQDFMPVEQVFYNEDGEKKRVMEFSGIQQMGGKMIPAVMEMRTLNKNSRTLIRYKSIDFKPVFSKSIFSFSQLRRK
jgi:outer membrane lipoprotein-sorting protein